MGWQWCQSKHSDTLSTDQMLHSASSVLANPSMGSTRPLGDDTSSLTMTQLNDAIKRWCSFPSPLVTVRKDEAAPDVQVEELHSAWAKPKPNPNTLALLLARSERFAIL